MIIKNVETIFEQTQGLYEKINRLNLKILLKFGSRDVKPWRLDSHVRTINALVYKSLFLS